MFFVVAAVLVIGTIVYVGGGHAVKGFEKDTRATSDTITDQSQY